MEGGIGILLLLIIAVVVGVLAIGLYVTGGALLGGSGRKTKDDDGHRPEHERATSPTQEKVHMVGARDESDSSR